VTTFVIMRNSNQSLVIDILRKEYPEIEYRIQQRIKETVPVKLEDFDLIPLIISSFKRIKGIEYQSWTGSPGGRKKLNIDRDLLLGTIILFYHPEKLMQMTHDKSKHGLMVKVADELSCNRLTLSKSLQPIIVAFKAYREFKEEVYRIYELIKIENNLLEYGKAIEN